MPNTTRDLVRAVNRMYNTFDKVASRIYMYVSIVLIVEGFVFSLYTELRMFARWRHSFSKG